MSKQRIITKKQAQESEKKPKLDQVAIEKVQLKIIKELSKKLDGDVKELDTEVAAKKAELKKLQDQIAEARKEAASQNPQQEEAKEGKESKAADQADENQESQAFINNELAIVSSDRNSEDDEDLSTAIDEDAEWVDLGQLATANHTTASQQTNIAPYPSPGVSMLGFTGLVGQPEALANAAQHCGADH